MDPETILWRRLDRPGHEAARLLPQGAGWRLEGTAVFVHAGLPVRLDYHINLDAGWLTIAAHISGWIGRETMDCEILSEHGKVWRINGVEIPAIAGCLDIDLNFSPSTNLIPIRRLNLEINQAAPVRAAWLRFPALTLEPLGQVYRRLGSEAYRYESAGGTFAADLSVNPVGFVTLYPGLWTSESSQ